MKKQPETINVQELLSDKPEIQRCARALGTMIRSLSKDRRSGKMHYEALVSTTAALVGETALRAGSPDVDRAVAGSNVVCSPETLTFLEKVSRLLRAMFVVDKRLPSFPAFDSFVVHTQQTLDQTDFPVLTALSPAFRERSPAVLAAEVRDDLTYGAERDGLSLWDQASACVLTLVDHVFLASGRLSPDVIYRLAMETAVGLAHKTPTPAPPSGAQIRYSRRLSEASDEISFLVLESCIAVERTLVQPSTLIAASSILLGEMTCRAAVNPMPKESRFLQAGAIEQFLFQASEMLRRQSQSMGSSLDALPSFESFLQHTRASIGGDPYPQLTIPEGYHPHGWPWFTAALMRDEAFDIARRFRLDPWGLANATAIALAGLRAEIDGALAPELSYRLAMEEAVGVAHVTPIDVNRVLRLNDGPIRRSLEEIRRRVAIDPKVMH
jgi:hypothetical protein